MIYLIGAGGVGSWLAPVMAKLLANPKHLILVDGDTLEEKNLDRQLFTSEDIGKNKAVALSERLGCQFSDKWYHHHNFQHEPEDWLLGCVDNNPGRDMVLKACDLYDCNAIIAANEVHSSEAYVYRPEWRKTKLDPRMYYPEIEQDDSGDPARRGMGCTGVAQTENRQLVTANFMAASLAAHLFVVWGMEYRKSSELARAYMPHRLRQNLTRNEFTLRGELENQKTETKGS